MKIVSISGSNRKKGNTNELLRSLDKELIDASIPDLKVKKYSLSDLHLEPCRACLKCKRKGYCVIQDDFGKIAIRLTQSDTIILGSPVYFSDVSGPVKILIDRTVSLWHTKQLKGKRLILAAACAEYGTDHTIETMKLWAKDHEMEIVATIEGKGEKMGSVLKDEKAMESVKNAATSLAKSSVQESS